MDEDFSVSFMAVRVNNRKCGLIAQSQVIPQHGTGETGGLNIRKQNQFLQCPASVKLSSKRKRQGGSFGGQEPRGGICLRAINFGVRGYLEHN